MGPLAVEGLARWIAAGAAVHLAGAFMVGGSSAGIMAAAAGLLTCTAILLRGEGRERPVARVLLAAGAASSIVALSAIGRLLLDSAGDVPPQALVARFVSAVLGFVGLPSSAADGHVHVEGASGALSFAMYPEVWGLPDLLLLSIAWLATTYVCSLPRGCPGRIALVLLVLAVGRAVLVVVTGAGVHEPLLRATGVADHDPLSGTWIWLACLVAAVVDIGGGVERPPRIPERPAGAVFARWAVTASCLGLLAGFAYQYVPAGASKSGRILIDDRLSQEWAPARRRPSFDWYGDFATYGFGAFSEYLGYYYSVAVNASQPYSPELLRDWDVLVIKVPQSPLADDELVAVLDFVRSGGAVVAIGDHTNLLRSSDILNQVTAPMGIWFNSDTLLDAERGGFSYFRAGMLPAHPAIQATRAVEFMSGCSLTVTAPAESVISVDNQYSQAHDYANSSNFGAAFGDPARHRGRHCLVATAEYGRGRVVAIADSTMFATFGLFLWDRDRLIQSVLAYCNHEASPFRSLLDLVAVMAAVLAVAVAFLAVPSAGLRVAAVVSLCLGLGVGVGFGARLNEELYAWPEPQLPPHHVAWWVPGTEVILPPTLGSAGPLRYDFAYDTLYAAIPRAGLFPHLAQSAEDVQRSDIMLVINPSQPPEPGMLRDIALWVMTGGTLVVATGREHSHPEACDAWLLLRADGDGAQPERALARGQEEPTIMPGFETIQVTQRAFGAGCVLAVTGSENWSRSVLGHAMAIPDAQQARAYKDLRALLDACSGTGETRPITYRIL